MRPAERPQSCGAPRARAATPSPHGAHTPLAPATFSQAFAAFFALKGRSLGNPKHLVQWGATMETYVFPTIGHRPVSEITSGEVLTVLEPIWHDKPETAKRILQRMRAVFESAILRNWRERTSPCVGVAQGARRNCS